MRNLVIVILCACTLFAAPAESARASKITRSCAKSKCQVGDVVTTYSRKDDAFHTCPSRWLSRYTTFALSLASTNQPETGRLPKISAKTGEPQYISDSKGPNKTRQTLERMRADSKVSTLDQAIAKCSRGVDGRAVTIMNLKYDDRIAWVSDNKTQQTYWMPLSHIDK